MQYQVRRQVSSAMQSASTHPYLEPPQLYVAVRTKNPVCRAASLDCAKHRIVPSYDIRHLEKCCGACGDSASNVNLVKEPTQHKVRRQVSGAI